MKINELNKEEKTVLLFGLMDWHCGAYFEPNTLYVYHNSGAGKVGSVTLPHGVYDETALRLAWCISSSVAMWSALSDLKKSELGVIYQGWLREHALSIFTAGNINDCLDKILELSQFSGLLPEPALEKYRSRP
jgi:hypothetical protein